MPHLVYIIFLFALGSCIGSFLNVVVYRLPRGQSLITPPSRCPQCEKKLAWYDNFPVLGWIFLGGKCRYCRKPISPIYPIVEAITGLIFVFYYVMYFMVHVAPCLGMRSLPDDWPMYGIDMMLLAGLLAASIIDAELFIIPASIPWWIAGVAVVVHAGFDRPDSAQTLLATPGSFALSAGASLGLLISIALLQLKIFPLSFPEGDLLEFEREELKKQNAQDIPPELTPKQVRAEMRKEMLFLMPPMLLGGICLALHLYWPPAREFWTRASHIQWLGGALGSLLGAMIGAFVVWLARILGSYGFGREAMGLGDAHLMFGVGAVLGGGMATITFFLAPFFSILIAIYIWLNKNRRQLPLGPYLSLATAFVMLFYCPIAAYLEPGVQGLLEIFRRTIGLS